MSGELNEVVVSLAIASGGVTLGYLLSSIVYLLQRIVADLDAQLDNTEPGRRRGRRTDRPT